MTSFRWCGHDVFRFADAVFPLALSCFPLVPFSNRIARGAFDFAGVNVRLPPNHADFAVPLHGHGWLAAWRVTAAEPTMAVLRYDHVADAWPWAYRAEQRFAVESDGYRHTLSIQNRSPEPMPAGVGLHPYLPRRRDTRLAASHAGYWVSDSAGLPVQRAPIAPPGDYWEGQPVGERIVDTTFIGRSGPLVVDWPDTGVRLTIAPSAELAFTVVYVPTDEDFFCVEPVSHMTDAVNRPEPTQETGLRTLAPAERFEVSVDFRVEALS